MFVSEWMSHNPQSVGVDTPIMEAMHLLRKGGYRRLPVIDGGRVVGIVTDSDLKNAAPESAPSTSVYDLNFQLSKLLVSRVMSSPAFTVSPSDPVEEAALLMADHKISGLPVCDGDTLIGMITVSDVLRAFVDMLGVREGGKRVTVSLPDTPGILAKAAGAAAPSNIVAAVTSGIEAGKRREVVLRVRGEGEADFADRLRALGIDVKDMQ